MFHEIKYLSALYVGIRQRRGMQATAIFMRFVLVFYSNTRRAADAKRV